MWLRELHASRGVGTPGEAYRSRVYLVLDTKIAVHGENVQRDYASPPVMEILRGVIDSNRYMTLGTVEPEGLPACRPST
jgi:hypothetical protein